MPVTVHYNAHVVTVPPRIEALILFLLAHQEKICQLPFGALRFHLGAGAEVKASIEVPLARPSSGVLSYDKG